MLRNRVLILLGGCLLMASAALADDLGFVDCTSHPEDTQIFAKARKSQDVVGTIPCGERFKVVLYGFIFSEIQTADGKVGFVYSSILTVDRGATLQSRAGSDTSPRLSAASETTKIPADPKPAPKRQVNMGGATSIPEQVAAAPAPAPAPTQPVATQPAPAAPAVQASAAPEVSAPAATDANASASNGQGTAAAAPPAQPAPAPAAAATPSLPDGATVQKATESANADAASAAAPAAPTPAPAAAPDAAPAVPASATAATDSSASATDATPAANPAAAPVAAPEPAQPAAAPAPQPRPVESAKIRTESWEKPNSAGRSTSLLEFFGGFAYSRMNAGGGVSNNFLGGVGAFGVNLKPWLQIAGDSSYNYYNVTGTKYVLYGNHYGPRVFLHRHMPFGVRPFAEALFGGSREDATVTGPSGYTTSTNGFSWKVGGGIDMRASKLFSIRLIDVDYYRTAFGTGANQSNYWISTGIVLRLFKSWSDQ